MIDKYAFILGSVTSFVCFFLVGCFSVEKTPKVECLVFQRVAHCQACHHDGEILDIPEKLTVLARHKNQVLTRLQLLEATQDVVYEGFERSIDQHIKNLRRKMKEQVGDLPIIQTVYGVGYRLDEQ